MVRGHVGAVCLVVWLMNPGVGWAQRVDSPPVGTLAGADQVQPQSAGSPSVPDGFWAPFQQVPTDFARFFSLDTARVVGVGGAGALAAYRWDGQKLARAQFSVTPAGFRVGNVGGGFLVQAGASFGLYAMGRATGSRTLTGVGADLVRAQVLTQGIVQAGKLATQRSRPDMSSRHSLPSGHTAAAFATATVLQDHFGWKVGVPAYGFGAYVGASRMAVHKHYLSDVVLGAAIGVAAGRTVTIGSGRARVALGVAPTLGGAMVTVSKR